MIDLLLLATKNLAFICFPPPKGQECQELAKSEFCTDDVRLSFQVQFHHLGSLEANLFIITAISPADGI